jgi:hypothetical protein
LIFDALKPSVNHSLGLLAAPHVRRNGRRILRGDDRRRLPQTGRDGLSSPRVAEGRRRLWLIDDLDAAIAPSMVQNDLAEDL